MYEKVFIPAKKHKLTNNLFNSHENLRITRQKDHRNSCHSYGSFDGLHDVTRYRQTMSVSLDNVSIPPSRCFETKTYSDRSPVKTVKFTNGINHQSVHKDGYRQLSKSLSLPGSLRNLSNEYLAQLTSYNHDNISKSKPIEKNLAENNRILQNPISNKNLSLTSKNSNPICKYILKNQNHESKKEIETQECDEFSNPNKCHQHTAYVCNKQFNGILRNRSNSSPPVPLSRRREQLVVGKDGLFADKTRESINSSTRAQQSSRSVQLRKQKLLKSFSCSDQDERENLLKESLRKNIHIHPRSRSCANLSNNYLHSLTDKTHYFDSCSSTSSIYEAYGNNMRTKDDAFCYMQPSENDSLSLSFEAAACCKTRRSSIDHGRYNDSHGRYNDSHGRYNDSHGRYNGSPIFRLRKTNSEDIAHDSESEDEVFQSNKVILEKNPFQLRTRKQTHPPLSNPLKSILKDSDRAFFYGDKTSPKSIRNDKTTSPTLTHRSPPEGESTGSDMLILEQDLNDDINLYRENSVINEFETRKIKTLLRCDSAPDKLYKDRLMQIEKERSEKERRRNSSIECRTNRVRFKLEETFKEEEERYLQLSEAENDHVTTYEDVEVFKKSVKPVSLHKVESVNDVEQINAPKVISPRQRKVSVFSFAEAVPIKLESTEHKIEPCKTKVESLKVDTVNYGRKMSITEETIPVKTVSSKRKKSLLTPLTKIINSDKGSQSSVDSIGKEKSKSKQKKSLQEESKKQRKKSKQECSPVAQRRKSSVTERKVSITDTLRSVVGNNKKKKSATENPDLNNNKRSAWSAIKGKIKIEKRNSANGSPTQSPRNFRFFRNDSSSSIGSTGRFKRGSLSRDSDRSLSDSFDRKSTLSLNSEVENEDLYRTTVPYDKFKTWATVKDSNDISTETLPLLHVACSEGNVELAKTLVDCGVDVNELDIHGWPALHYAICSGHFDCAELLITHGCHLKQYSNRIMNTYCSEIRKAVIGSK